MNEFDGHIGGMHFIWWIVFSIILILIFRVPRDITFWTSKKVASLQRLKNRFAKVAESKKELEESNKNSTPDDKLSNKDDERA